MYLWPVVIIIPWCGLQDVRYSWEVLLEMRKTLSYKVKGSYDSGDPDLEQMLGTVVQSFGGRCHGEQETKLGSSVETHHRHTAASRRTSLHIT
ncbi:hypothetical protein PC128_g11432 [Phytophthora cactorum]|nr:hypothetical protein PC128_g11432 [Phytophthora cactorum]